MTWASAATASGATARVRSDSSRAAMSVATSPCPSGPGAPGRARAGALAPRPRRRGRSSRRHRGTPPCRCRAPPSPRRPPAPMRALLRNERRPHAGDARHARRAAIDLRRPDGGGDVHAVHPHDAVRRVDRVTLRRQRGQSAARRRTAAWSWSARHATPRYMAPVSTCRYPSAAATARATVPFPTPDGPSMAMIRSCRPYPARSIRPSAGPIGDRRRPQSRPLGVIRAASRRPRAEAGRTV